MTGQPRWVARDPRLLRRARWDAETFVFNPRSGHTHVLNQEAVRLLDELSDTPSSARDLEELFDAQAPEEKTFLVQQLLQLETLGLVRRS